MPPRHQPLPDHGAGVCVDVQLVKLVLPRRQPERTHAGHHEQATLYLTPMHGKANILRSLIANIRAALQHVRVTAEQFKTTDPWTVLMRYVSDKIRS